MTALLALVLTAGGVAACDVKASSDSPAQAVSAAPDAVLKAAVHALESTAHTFGVKQGKAGKLNVGSGSLDPAAKSGTIAMTSTRDEETIALAFTVIAPDLWLKADFGPGPNKAMGLEPDLWMHVDGSKLGPDDTKPFDEAGAPKFGIIDLFKNGLHDVKRTDATHFSGTVDVSDVDSLLSPSNGALDKVGDRAKSIPFTATVDDKGRLTAFTIDGGSIDSDLAYELTFAGFGSVLPVTKPVGAVPAPAEVYELFD
ncbi:hypothetical protein KZZ52_25755 [Dactylosporangium sp. AC04546]|uniref:hypothetical protein n=1 Tax=Dactylosporangium sp. AC04546 TaxID=2862460 RepID=UPI001EDE75A9|nr:hypothetical protein [Dactylosporangium sp. AC04546]WVK88677.1 hypothetical protein KZZ52_25755 [Dactylosporangium sp. AC04546]